MPKSESVIVSAQIPAEVRVELERRAEVGYRSVSAEIRIALDEYIARSVSAEQETIRR